MVGCVSATGHSTRHATFDLVVLVASLGGLDAISAVLAGLPHRFPTPVVVLQHLRDSPPAQSHQRLARLLQRRTVLPVHTTLDQSALSRPGVSVLPGGHTARFTATRRVEPRPADRLGGGDALLASAADTYGASLIAVVLTGCLRDGAEGVRAVKRHGGRVLVQDPTTAPAPSMPRAAIATGCVDFVLPPSRLASALTALTMAPGAADLLTVPTPHWAQLDA